LVFAKRLSDWLPHPFGAGNLRLQEVRVGIGLIWFLPLDATANSLQGSRFSLLGNIVVGDVGALVRRFSFCATNAVVFWFVASRRVATSPFLGIATPNSGEVQPL
jgi:hypothetical protein